MLTVLERKLIGRFQNRYGPNRVGPFGILQPLADVGKLVGKQPFRPENAVNTLYVLGPALMVLSAVLALAIIPFGDVKDGVGFYGLDVSIGILYFFAAGSIGFYGLLLGGWASGSKYSFLGAMRSAAQLISYEVSMGLALLGVIMMSGSLSLVDIVRAQDGIWFIVPQLVGFLIFMVAGFAETNRAPFDLVEADSELVQGFMTEYGGMRFGTFLLVEYLEMTVVCGNRRGDVPRRLDGPRPGLPRPDLDAGEDLRPALLLHLGAGDAAAAALRPADGAGLEGDAAAGDAQRARDRGIGGGDLTHPRRVNNCPRYRGGKCSVEGSGMSESGSKGEFPYLKDDASSRSSAARSRAASAAPTAPSGRRCAG